MRVAHPIGGFGRKHNSAKATQRVNAHETKARDKFDKWSNSSDFQQLRPWLAYVQRHVLDEIDWSRTTTVLDVACGSGWAVHEAARPFDIGKARRELEFKPAVRPADGLKDMIQSYRLEGWVK